MSSTFEDFENSFLLAAKRRCEESGENFAYEKDILKDVGEPKVQSWLPQAVTSLCSRGLIEKNHFVAAQGVGLVEYGGGHYLPGTVKMLHAGTRYADEIIEAARRKTLYGRLRSVPLSNWISIAALTASIFFALLKLRH